MSPGKNIHAIKINKIRGEHRTDVQDTVAAEEPLQIALTGDCVGGACADKDVPLVITMRTPGDDFNLTAGFLFSEGIVRGKDDIHRMSYCVGPDKDKQNYNYVTVALHAHVKVDRAVLRNFYATSSCGVCGKTSIDSLKQRLPTLDPDQPRVTRDVIRALPGKLRAEQAVFEKTGGLHAAALFDAQGKLTLLCEDVGRHNAVDKLIGAKLLEGKLPLSQSVMLVSGRLSFELVQKAALAGVPVLAAVGAPSSLAVELAREAGVTLIGFLRDEGFNIYSAPQRVQ